MARPPTYVSVLLGLVAAGASTYAWHLRVELNEARALPTAPQVQVAAAPAPVANIAEPPAEEAEAAPALRRNARPTATAVAEPGAEAALAGQERRGNPVRNSPQVRQLMALQQRSMLDGRYAALFRKLNLSPGDLERLKTLLVERQSASMDVFSAAREQGMDGRENRDEIRGLIKGLEAESDAAMRELLGETNYQQLQQYERTVPQRSIVSQLEQRLSYSNTPFYGNQAEQLVTLMAAATPQNRNAAVNTPLLPFATNALMLGGRVSIPDSVIAQSAGFLSAPQIQALREYQQEQQAQLQLLREMQQSRRNAPVTVPGGTGP